MPLLSLALGAGLFACKPGQPAPQASGSLPPAGVELDGAALTEMKDGEKVWELHAEHAGYGAASQLATLRAVVTRFWEDGAVVSECRAPQARFDLANRRLTLSGGVRLSSADQKSGFSAAQAVWNPADGRLDATGDVHFWRGPNRLHAAQLSADRAVRRVELAGGIRGVAVLGPSGTTGSLFPSEFLEPEDAP